jgi:hypothetical protein
MYPTGLGISENTLWGDHNISKLAESIVGECVSICEEHPAWTGRMIGEQIKQHFGVEEPKSWHCPKCGIDRTKAVCPKGHTAAITGDCPMTAEAQ